MSSSSILLSQKQEPQRKNVEVLKRHTIDFRLKGLYSSQRVN